MRDDRAAGPHERGERRRDAAADRATMNVPTLVRRFLADSEPTHVYECSACGTSLDADSDECPTCGCEEISVYEIR